MQEINWAWVLSQESGQNVVEPAHYQLTSWHVRQAVQAERAGGKNRPPGLGKSLEGIEAVYRLAVASSGNDLQRGAGVHAELQRHATLRGKREGMVQRAVRR